jgi:small subunit ribosomal protein S13
MARIGGVELPKNKKVGVALSYIFGIGIPLGEKILQDTGVNQNLRVKDLSEADIIKLREAVSKYTVEGDLRREISLNIKRLIEIGTYRGQRHRKNLPTRGQRTKTNARTRRGRRKTIAGKKQVAKA